MKWSLVILESLDHNSQKMEGIYKADNFINDIAFGASFKIWLKYISPIVICNKFL